MTSARTSTVHSGEWDIMALARRQFLGLGGLLAAAAVAGCARQQAGTPIVAPTGSNVPGRTSGGVVTDPGDPTSIEGVAELRGTGSRRAATDSATAGTKLGTFAAALFRAAAPGDGNAVISPYSVLDALSMTQYAARGDAAEAMASTLGGDPDAVAGWITAVDAAVARAVASGTENSSGAPVQTEVESANSLFAQSGLPVRQAFLDHLATGYGAGLRTCDFQADPEACRAGINGWVADRTHDLITKLLSPPDITRDTRLVLVNALYLSAAWDTEFHRGPSAPFATPNGAVRVPYLGITEDLRYTSGDGWSAVRVPYAGGDLAMTVLLPDEGAFADVARGLDGSMLAAASAGDERKVIVRMPPFSCRTASSLRDPLTGMGLGPVFGGDLSGVTGRPGDLTVGNVVHQARIDVDEHGTKAAAATAVIAPAGAAPGQHGPDPVEFLVDRPFLYWIHDTATGFPLFLGSVTDPTG